MGFFGDDKAEEIAGLQRQLNESEVKRKRLAAALSDARQQIAEIATEKEKLIVQLEKARQTAQQARRRQKASVERANRFKARLNEDSSQTQSS